MIFSKEYLKLQKSVFTTIRKNTGFYKIGYIYQIITPSRRFKAWLIECQVIRKAAITDKMALSDADCGANELLDMLDKWYGKKFDDYVLLTFQKQ